MLSSCSRWQSTKGLPFLDQRDVTQNVEQAIGQPFVYREKNQMPADEGVVATVAHHEEVER
jgi:hypothetical protein